MLLRGGAGGGLGRRHQAEFCFRNVRGDSIRQTSAQCMTRTKWSCKAKTQRRGFAVPFWIRFEPFWHRFGTVLEPFWNPFWNRFGAVLEPFWSRVGTVLEPCWLCLRGSYLFWNRWPGPGLPGFLGRRPRAPSGALGVSCVLSCVFRFLGVLGLGVLELHLICCSTHLRNPACSGPGSLEMLPMRFSAQNQNCCLLGPWFLEA